VLSEPRVRQLLGTFGLDLSSGQVSQVLAYLDLLLRWNERINLTAIRNPEECITRHFGESFFLAKHVDLDGALLDIGSGAGFPGLALKIPFPTLAATLLEPVAKKRAFLKEAARVCGFTRVEVRPERLEEWVRIAPQASFDSVTSRAVGKLDHVVPLASQCLRPGGRIFLWLTRDQAASLNRIACGLTWDEPLPIPLSRNGVILPGRRHGRPDALPEVRTSKLRQGMINHMGYGTG
jgi:16S rRNA (guanine527-N7)-methyltransferase